MRVISAVLVLQFSQSAPEQRILFFNPQGLKVCAYLQAPCRRYARACLQGARVVPAGGRAGTKSSKKRVPALARAKFASKSVGQGQSFPKSPRPQRTAIEKSQARPRFWMPVCVFRLTFEKTTFVFLVVSHPIVPRGHGIHGVAPSAFEPSPRHQGERLQQPGKAAEHSRGSAGARNLTRRPLTSESREACGSRRFNETR